MAPEKSFRGRASGSCSFPSQRPRLPSLQASGPTLCSSQSGGAPGGHLEAIFPACSLKVKATALIVSKLPFFLPSREGGCSSLGGEQGRKLAKSKQPWVLHW